MKVLNEYPNSHHYLEEYLKCDNAYCVNCGEKKVWGQQGSGDYYQGVNYVCTGCSSVFTYQWPRIEKASIVRQLISGITDTPTTPKGN